MQDVGALNSDNASLNAERREQDVRAVVLDDLAHFVEAFEQNGIKLGVCDHDRLDKHFGGHYKIVQTLLSTENTLRVLSRDVD